MNGTQMLRAISGRVQRQTPAQRALRVVLAVAMAAAVVVTVLPAWDVQLLALAAAVLGGVFAVAMPNSIALLVFLVGILANWVLRSDGTVGPLPVILGGILLVVLWCAIGCTLAAPDVRLPGRVWRRLVVAGLVGLAILFGTAGVLAGLETLEVPGLLPLLLLGLFLVPIAVWALVGPRQSGSAADRAGDESRSSMRRSRSTASTEDQQRVPRGR